MSTSVKFAGKNDSNVITPINVTNEGYVKERRKFLVSTGDIVNAVLNITEETHYPSYDAHNSGIVAVQIWNRTGVSIDVEFKNPATYNPSANPVSSIYDVNGERPVFTIPNEKIVMITAEDLPLLNYSPYINVSITPDDTPTGTYATLIRVFSKE